ncbi:hypothetical protein KIN20_004662 [Parelaphostrongylus tenuis]|uniref:Uncharacterized protein n=1 Tax=Parelaphostrongylus tenuis TaxID=148309 RepID=A0AAD5M232_PARTN|nr:hypothetical protein KIN20_004662 [Parelaphostrongylus tenuis]
MRKRETIAQKLLRRHVRAPFLAKLVTVNQKWIFFKSQRPPNQCLPSRQRGTPAPRPDRFTLETLFM